MILEKEKTSIKAKHGTELTCKGWIQEAAMRMLMNNLDPEVAENPAELIIYGGSGKAARNWDAYEAIINSLKVQDAILQETPETELQFKPNFATMILNRERAQQAETSV